jgi:hypothetical protein
MPDIDMVVALWNRDGLKRRNSVAIPDLRFHDLSHSAAFAKQTLRTRDSTDSPAANG